MPPVLSRTTPNTPPSSTPGVLWRSYTVKSRPLTRATPSQVPSQIRPSSPWATACTRLRGKPSSMFQRVTVWYAVCVSACAPAGHTPSTAQHTRSHANARRIRRTHVLRTQLVCACVPTLPTLPVPSSVSAGETCRYALARLRQIYHRGFYAAFGGCLTAAGSAMTPRTRQTESLTE